MSFLYSAQKGIADFTFIIGTGLKYGGAGSLFVMAVVGTISVDIVLLAYAEKRHNEFLTGFIIGSMLSRDNFEPIALLIASPITSAIAIGLSVALGVPQVGLAIFAGWAFASVLFAVGVGLQALSKAIKPEPEDAFNYYASPACSI